MPPPCIGFEIGLGHICWYFRAYICSKILKVLHPCIGFGIGLGHIWGHANAWIWYIHAYAWILYIHVLSHISHIPKAEIFGFMFQYLSSERMGLRFWANPIHNTWLDHGEISRTRCTPFCPVMLYPCPVALSEHDVWSGWCRTPPITNTATKTNLMLQHFPHSLSRMSDLTDKPIV